MKLTHRTITAAVIPVVGVLALSACSTGSTSVSNDQKATNNQLQGYQRNQPTPKANWSQYRQTVLDVENAEINGVATTTFFYNQGSPVPIKSCPSIGYPVAADAQLTNPQQVVRVDTGNNNWVDGVIGQQEPNGVYSSSTTQGTYVVCVQPDGTKRIDYWEGYVEAEGGQASVDSAGHIADSGSTTVTSKSHP